MGIEFFYPLFPLCVLHVVWMIFGLAKVRRRWIALPAAALVAAAVLAGVAFKLEVALAAFGVIWLAWLVLPLVALVRGIVYVVRLPEPPRLSGGR